MKFELRFEKRRNVGSIYGAEFSGSVIFELKFSNCSKVWLKISQTVDGRMWDASLRESGGKNSYSIRPSSILNIFTAGVLQQFNLSFCFPDCHFYNPHLLSSSLSSSLLFHLYLLHGITTTTSSFVFTTYISTIFP